MKRAPVISGGGADRNPAHFHEKEISHSKAPRRCAIMHSAWRRGTITEAVVRFSNSVFKGH